MSSQDNLKKSLSVLSLQVKEQNDGAVVRAQNFGANGGFLHVLHQAARDDEVVQSPSNVLGSSVASVAPECVGAGCFWMQCAERVDEACVEKIRKSVALFLCESGVFLVGLENKTFHWMAARAVK